MIYAEDLSAYDLGDIAIALERIATTPRRDGETAFPEIATILAAIREVKTVSGERRALEAENARVAHFHANPELYMTGEETKELAAKLNAKFSMDEKPKVIQTKAVEICCPFCSHNLPLTANFRLMTVAEIREMADILEGVRAVKG